MSKAAKLAVIAGRADTLVDTTNTGDVELNFGQYQNFILTFTGAVVFTNPTTEAIGQSGFIICIQDGTGSRGLTINGDYETAGGVGITLSTNANAVDMIPYVVQSASNILLGHVQKGFCIVAFNGNGNLTGSAQYFNDKVFYNGVATQSLRFDDGSSAYLTRTPSGAGNQKTWTFSTWLKRSILNPQSQILSVGNTGAGSPWFLVYFADDDNLNVYWYTSGTVNSNQTFTPKFRDTSAWYNIVLMMDTTQNTDSNRVKLYINGVEASHGNSQYPTKDYDTLINGTSAHHIGRHGGGSYFDGYLAETIMLDGTSTDASSFGETKNGIWIPIDTSGLTFGTNGFRLEYKKTSVGSGSSSTIGADTSGQNNHWTSSGIVASDCAMPDSPENNFCTLNSLDPFSGTLSEGNLKYNNGASFRASRGNFAIPSSGKWYFEVLNASATSGSSAIFAGVAHADSNISAQPNNGSTTKLYGIYNDSSLGILSNGSQSSSTSNTISADSILQFAIDADNNKFYVGINNSYYTNATTSASFNASNPTESIDLAGYRPFVGAYSNTGILNCGQDASFTGEITAGTVTDGNGIGVFKYAPPLGFLALCSANLEEPTIGPNVATQADNYFGILTWSGDDDARDISVGASGITGTVDFTPDLAWIKRRNGSSNGSDHLWIDTSRGVNQHKGLTSNHTSAEGLTEAGSSWTNFGDIVSFKAGGFNGSASGTEEAINESGGTYVAWNWKANGGITTTNDASATGIGSQDSVYQANTTAGFSIVTYTGTQSNDTFAHGLGVAPNWILHKRRDSAQHWVHYHVGIGNTRSVLFNTDAQNSASAVNFNNTSPTSTVFSLGTDAYANASGGTYVAYCFADVEGYSKFGSYIGNGLNDGTFIYTGFRPAFILVKSLSSGKKLDCMYDSVRDVDNPAGSYLAANLIDQEFSSASTYAPYDFVSNGFKLVRGATDVSGTVISDVNTSGQTYIYMAFAEAPFKYANAR